MPNMVWITKVDIGSKLGCGSAANLDIVDKNRIIIWAEIFRGKKILELGAGVGITATVFSRFLDPSQFIAADFTLDILQNLRLNLMISQSTLILFVVFFAAVPQTQTLIRASLEVL